MSPGPLAEAHHDLSGVMNCTECHEHSRNNTNNEHNDVPNYRYESQACFDCHPKGRE